MKLNESTTKPEMDFFFLKHRRHRSCDHINASNQAALCALRSEGSGPRQQIPEKLYRKWSSIRCYISVMYVRPKITWITTVLEEVKASGNEMKALAANTLGISEELCLNETL